MALKCFDGGEVWGSSIYQARGYVQSDASAIAGGRIVPGLFRLSVSGGSMTTPSLGAQNPWSASLGLRNLSHNWQFEMLTRATEQVTFVL